MYKSGLSDFANVWKIWFKLVADSWQVSVNWIRFYVMTHKYSVKAEHFSHRFHGHVVHADKGEVRVESQSIVLSSANVDCLSQSNSSFTDQVFVSPWLPVRLPWTYMGSDHFLAAPNVSNCGGLNCEMLSPGTSFCAFSKLLHEIASATSFRSPGM